MNKIIYSKQHQQFNFRLLAPNDGQALTNFFLALSGETKSKFGPHPLTVEYAHKLCTELTDNKQSIRRFVISKGGGENNEIVGYFIVDFNPFSDELKRYKVLDINIDCQCDPVFAPCISDAYQNTGLASQAMSSLIDYSKENNLRRLVLMGGTQKPNTLARFFYKKFNFKEYASFYTEHNQLDNIDMMLSL